MRPPLFFRLAERKVAAAAVEKKGALAQSRRHRRLFAQIRGSSWPVRCRLAGPYRVRLGLGEQRTASPHLMAWARLSGWLLERSGSGKRRTAHAFTSPESKSRVANTAAGYPGYACVRRTRQKPTVSQKPCASQLPFLPKLDPASGSSLWPSAFSFDRERPFSFRRRRKENGGFFPRRKAAQFPLPRGGTSIRSGNRR